MLFNCNQHKPHRVTTVAIPQEGKKNEEMVQMKQTELYNQQTMQMRKLVTIPLLAAIAFILQVLEFPLAPVIPSFLKLDFSTMPGLVGGLMFGPIAGVMIELLKNILHLLLKNNDALFIGELANFVAGASFIYTVVWIQRLRQGRGSFVLGLVGGTLVMTVIMSVANVYVLFPAYAALYQVSVPDLLQQFQMDSIWSLILYGIAPFNIIKGISVSLLAYPIFMKVAPRLQVRT